MASSPVLEKLKVLNSLFLNYQRYGLSTEISKEVKISEGRIQLGVLASLESLQENRELECYFPTFKQVIHLALQISKRDNGTEPYHTLLDEILFRRHRSPFVASVLALKGLVCVKAKKSYYWLLESLYLPEVSISLPREAVLDSVLLLPYHHLPRVRRSLFLILPRSTDSCGLVLSLFWQNSPRFIYTLGVAPFGFSSYPQSLEAVEGVFSQTTPGDLLLETGCHLLYQKLEEMNRHYSQDLLRELVEGFRLTLVQLF